MPTTLAELVTTDVGTGQLTGYSELNLPNVVTVAADPDMTLVATLGIASVGGVNLVITKAQFLNASGANRNVDLYIYRGVESITTWNSSWFSAATAIAGNRLDNLAANKGVSLTTIKLDSSVNSVYNYWLAARASGGNLEVGGNLLQIIELKR